MRVVVVGCNGFIGKSLITELNNLGIKNVGISKESFDLMNKSTIKSLHQTFNPNDQIVFTSAITPSKSAEDVRKTIKMAEYFCESLKNIEFKQVMLISSDSVYGNKTGLINEDSSCDPDSFHGLAQVSREIILRDLTVSKLAILRLCAVYGAGDTHNGYGPNRFVNQINKSEPIKVLGQGLNVRNHIYIDDVINLILQSLILNFTGILNLVSGNSYSFQDVAEECKYIFNPQASIENAGSEGDIIVKNFDNSKIIEIFPDFVALDLNAGLYRWKSKV